MGFTYQEQRRLVAQWLRSKVKDVERAAELVTKVSAQKLSREIKRQMSSFKGNSKAFKKSVKVKDYRAIRGLPFASIVSIGIPWLKIFEEGGTIQGKKNLVILLTPGERLGLKRVTKGNPWTDVMTELKGMGRVGFVKVADGVIVYLRRNKKNIPVYKFQKSVTVPKKLDVYAAAREIGDAMPDEINKLINMNYD